MTSTSVKVIWADFGSIFTRLTRNLLIFNPCAQDETRTHTALRPLPPQSSVYTNFTTCARRNSLGLGLPLSLKFQSHYCPRDCSSQSSSRALDCNCDSIISNYSLVPRTGLEPARLATYAPETYASTNSATWASSQCARTRTASFALLQSHYCPRDCSSQSSSRALDCQFLVNALGLGLSLSRCLRVSVVLATALHQNQRVVLILCFVAVESARFRELKQNDVLL